MNIKNLFGSIRMDIVMLVMFGGILLFQSASAFIISFKPAISFEEMLDDKEVKAGSHVAGDVVYVFDYFASQSTYTKRSDGSRSGSRKSGNYYLIPTATGFVGLKSRQADVEALDTVTDETFKFLETGTEPTSTVFIEGIVSPMEAKIAQYYREYLGELGYTEKDIDDMGEPLLIENVSFTAVRVMFVLGIVFLFLAFFLLRLRYKRLCRGSGLPRAEDLPHIS